VLIYATQFIWRIIPPATRWMSETLLSTVLGVGGQSLVVLAIITQNGLSADAGSLAQIGVGTLSMLAVLVFTTGRLLPGNVTRRSALQHDEARHQTRVQRARAWQHWFSIGAGMLLCMAVSWELAATRQTTLDLLTLAPASYLIIIAPFVTRNDTLIGHQRVGQILAMLGAALLLLPTLWLSFSNTNLLPTLILLGETLVLLLIGITTRIRVFVLSSASLIIIGGLHMLFLQSLGIPTSLALALLGTVLLAIATGFALARHRLQSAWANWE
jgi:hypothetical protein